MALTESQIDAEIDALVLRIGKGYERLQSGDKSVSYQLISEQERALQLLKNEKASRFGGQTVRRGVFYDL